MRKETLVIRPEKHKRRIGVLPTYAQRDRTKYSRKAKHRGQDGQQGGSVDVLVMQNIFPNVFQQIRRISSVGRANVS